MFALLGVVLGRLNKRFKESHNLKKIVCTLILVYIRVWLNIVKPSIDRGAVRGLELFNNKIFWFSNFVALALHPSLNAGD